MSLRIEVAPGEIIDKLTILEIKRERIADEAKRKNVAYEWDVLTRDLVAAVQRGDKEFRVAPGDYRFAKPWPS